MTKFEWERQLKKGISGLPKAEQQRVLDYYNELFADKIDAGLREQYIISEFGNPYDVANKILVDFYNEGKENPEVDAYIYSSSDEIDVAFDEEPAPATVAAPERKTFSERREEKRETHNQAHDERTYQHNTANEADVDDQKTKKGAKSAGGLIAILCVLAYFVVGACFNMWHPTWLIFLLIPCIITLIEAINKRNWRIFAYPVFVVFLYLLMGFYAHNWHPGWVLFITIPVYYVLGNFITKNSNGNVERRNKKQQTKAVEQPQPVQRAEQPANKKNENAKNNSGNGGVGHVISIIAKVLLTLCLVWVAFVVIGFVISVFCGGVGLMIGAVASFVAATIGELNMLAIGFGLAQLGLGIVCCFGMIALIKPCFNMCKSFVKTIKKSFDNN